MAGVNRRNFPDWLRAFTEYGSFGEAPLKMLFWTGISTIAGALRRRVWIDQRYFQWTPNFYVILVAPPGIVSKTTTINIGMNLLRQVPGVHFGPDVVTWQALATTFATSTEGITDEATGEIHTMSAITVASDEFGNFLNPHDREMVDLFVTLWDGKRGVFNKVTKMSGSDSIENPWLNGIACTTPAWIAGNFPQYLIGGGFTSRCVFVYADRKRVYVPYVDENVPEDFSDQGKRLLEDLITISEVFGEFKLHSEAREWGREWYKQHWTSKNLTLDNEQFAGYLARKQTHLHKLAMVLAISSSNELVIHKRHLEAADQFLSVTEQDMPLVFNRIGLTDTSKYAVTIVDFVRASGGIEKTELYRHMFRSMTYKEFEDSLNSAVHAGYLFLRQEADGNLMVRPLGGA